MSVIRVRETGKKGRESENDRTRWTKKEFTREFVVVTSSDDDDERVVLKARLIPEVGEGLGNGSDALCIDLFAERDPRSARVWNVTAIYRQRELTKQEKEVQDKVATKTMQPPGIRSGFAKSQEPVHEARSSRVMQDGKKIRTTGHTPIVNSAGEEFAQRPTKNKSTLWVEVSRFEADNNGQISSGRYIDAVNADSFWGCEPGQVILYDLPAERLFMQTSTAAFFYWKVRYIFHFRKEGWDKVLVDRGKNELADLIYRSMAGFETGRKKDGTTAPITNSRTGLPVTSPVHLDGKGHALNDPAASPVLIHFDVYSEAFFRWLKLPQLRIVL